MNSTNYLDQAGRTLTSPLESDWQAEHQKYAHIEPNFHKWKAALLTRGPSPYARPAGDDMGTGIAKSIFGTMAAILLVALALSTGLGLLLKNL